MRGGRAGDQSRARTHKLRLFGNRWLMSENWVRGTGRPPLRNFWIAPTKPRPPAYTRYSPETWLATHFLTNLTARAKKVQWGLCGRLPLDGHHYSPFA